MKTKGLLIVGLLFSLSVYSSPVNDKYDATYPSKNDTIEIEIGDSKLIIVVNSQEELEQLKDYDINSMLKDLNIKIEESDESDQLVIEDESGKRYLKDTTVVYNKSEFEDFEDEFEEAFDGELESADDDPDLTYYNKPINKKVFRGQKTRHRTVFDLGTNNYLMDGKFPDASNEPYTVKPFGSWYVALGPSFQTHIAGKLALEWGANISWYNFKYQDASQRIMQGDDVVFWEPSSDPSPIKSKLTATYINVSLVPVLDFGYKRRVETYSDGSTAKYLNYDDRNFRIGIGGYAGYKVDSYSKFVYKDGGKRKDHTKKSYYLENIRYGIRLEMGYDDLDFFVNYDMNTLFHENRGPELNAFSFGISF